MENTGTEKAWRDLCGKIPKDNLGPIDVRVVMTNYYKGSDCVLFKNDIDSGIWYIWMENTWIVYSYAETPSDLINSLIPSRRYTLQLIDKQTVNEEIFLGVL